MNPVPALRWTAVIATAVLGAVLAWPGVARGHGPVLLTIHGDGRGSVWVSAVWQDGHPVTEPVTATLTATSSDGRRVGPEALGAMPGGARYRGMLGGGEWTVVTESIAPGLGRCEAVLRVAPGGGPGAPGGSGVPGAPGPSTDGTPSPGPPVQPVAQRVQCGEPGTAAAVAADEPPGSGSGWLLPVAAVVLVVAAGAFIAVRRGSR